MSGRVLVVVPTNTHVDEHLRDQALQHGAAMGVGVVDFGEFTRRVHRATAVIGDDGRPPLSRMEAELLAHDRLALSRRRAARFVRLWDTLRRAGMDVARLRRVAGRVRARGDGAGDAARLRGFADLAHAYERARMDLGRADAATVVVGLAAAVEAASARRLSQALQGADHVEIQGHLDIGWARARWLESLARRGVHVRVTLPGGALGRGGQESTRRNLEDFAPHVRVDELPSAEELGDQIVSALGRAAERETTLDLPVPNAGSAADVGRIDALSTVFADDGHEVRDRAVAIVHHWRREGLAGSVGRVAIVDPEAATTGDAWVRAFERAGDGLTVDDRRGRPLGRTIAGRALLGSIDAWRHALHRDRLCDWLGGPWASGWAGDGDGAAELRAALTAVGSRDDRRDGHLARLRAAGHASEAAMLESVIARVRWPSRGTLAQYVARAREQLAMYTLADLPTSEDGLGSAPAVRAAHERVAGARALERRLGALHDAAHTVTAARTISLDEWARFVDEDLADARLRRPGARRGQVVLATPDDLAGRRFDRLVMVGLVDGVFPRLAIDDGFLDAAERSAIETALGRPVFRRPRPHDRLRLAGALRAARHAVVAIAPRVDGRGVPIVGRSFFDGLTALAGDAEVLPAATERGGPARWGLGPTRLSAPSAISHVGVLARSLPGVHARLGLDPAGAVRWTTSASALERYAACPYRFFAERVLGLGELAAGDELDARGAGQLGHEALAAVFERLRAAGLLPVRGGADATREDRVATGAVDDVLDAWVRRQPVGVRPFFELEGERLRRAALAILAAERSRAREGWTPFAFELGFGSGPGFGSAADGRSDALELRDPAPGPELERGVVRVRGRLDRVDVRGDGERDELLIVDYKRGRVGGRVRGQDLGRTALQLPLYVMWAHRNAERLLAVAGAGESGRRAEPRVDARLVSLDDGRRSHSSVRQCMQRDSALAELLDPAVAAEDADAEEPARARVAAGAAMLPMVEGPEDRRRVVDTVWAFTRGVEAGRFDARPVDAATCGRCPHAPVCRIRDPASDARGGAG